MTRKRKLAEMAEFDAAEHLRTDEDVVNYLNAVLADGDPALVPVALGDIARARGMTQIAEKSGITREALYKALRPGSKPRFDTISKVCAALGMRLSAVPEPN